MKLNSEKINLISKITNLLFYSVMLLIAVFSTFILLKQKVSSTFGYLGISNSILTQTFTTGLLIFVCTLVIIKLLNKEYNWYFWIGLILITMSLMLTIGIASSIIPNDNYLNYKYSSTNSNVTYEGHLSCETQFGLPYRGEIVNCKIRSSNKEGELSEGEKIIVRTPEKVLFQGSIITNGYREFKLELPHMDNIRIIILKDYNSSLDYLSEKIFPLYSAEIAYEDTSSTKNYVLTLLMFTLSGGFLAIFLGMRSIQEILENAKPKKRKKR